MQTASQPAVRPNPEERAVETSSQARQVPYLRADPYPPQARTGTAASVLCTFWKAMFGYPSLVLHFRFVCVSRALLLKIGVTIHTAVLQLEFDHKDCHVST